MLPLLMLVACADDTGGVAAPPCQRNQDCDSGLCQEGRCIAASGGDQDAAAADALDASPGDDTVSGIDDAADSGTPDIGTPPTDATPDIAVDISDTPEISEDIDTVEPPDVEPDVPFDPYCESDDECPGLQWCDLDADEPTCVEPLICLADEDCAPGRVCDRGGCASTWSGCGSDEDCSGGACDPLTHSCMDIEPCTSTADCADGHLCEEKACVECITPVDCPSPAMKCVANLCYEPTACGKDSECLEGAVCLGSACTQPIFADDPFEQNDVASAAQPLPPGTWPELTIQNWDDDWYVAEVPAGQGLIVRVRFAPGAGDLDLTLFDTTGAHVLSTDASKQSWAVVGVSARPSPQGYLIHVQNTSGTVPSYEIASFLTHKPFCLLDPLDLSTPNDGPETAVLLQGTELVTQGTSLCPGETDWFKIETFGSSSITAAIEFPHTLGDLDVRIYDGDQELASASSAGGDFEVASVANVQAGTWYVEVRGATEADHNGYELTIKTVSSASCQLDSMEVNDGPASAPAFEGTNQQLTLCPGDVDWFATTVPAGMGLVSTITYANFSSQLAVDLIDSDGSTLLTSAPGATFPKGVKTQAASYEAAGKSKTVYTRVRRIEPLVADQFTPYTLQVAVVQGFCLDDEAEPDSGWDMAHPLQTLPGQSTTGKICPGDAGDWFSVKLDGSSVLTVDLQHDVDTTPLELALFQPDGITQEPVVASFFNDKGKVLVFDATKSAGASGTWYVRVSGGKAAEYRISAALADKGACPLDDLWEPNDTPFSSKPLTKGATISPFLCANNPDFFQIQASLGTSLTLSVTPPASSPKVVFQLLDPELTLVWSESVTVAKQIALGGKITKAGTWFLSFRSPLSGTYAIKLEGSQ